MKNETLYNKTVSILVDAYFNDTLEHGVCTACAVGNLICANAYNGDKELFNKNYDHNDNWNAVIYYSRKPRFHNYKHIAKFQIDSTGYSVIELAAIEKAFEFANRNKNYGEEETLNGLMAVIDVLDIIHENTDTVATQQTKSRFNKPVLS